MKLNSYRLPGLTQPADMLFPRLPVMARVLNVSALVDTGATGPVTPLLRILDGSNVVLLELPAEPVPASSPGSVVNWCINSQLDPAQLSFNSTGVVSRGFIPPDFFLPPNWQLTVSLVGADATTVLTSAQLTTLTPE